MVANRAPNSINFYSKSRLFQQVRVLLKIFRVQVRQKYQVFQVQGFNQQKAFLSDNF